MEEITAEKLMEVFMDALEHHKTIINKTNERLNYPSTQGQLVKCKDVCLRGQNKLFIENRLEYPQDALDILESDLNDLKSRYDLLIKRIDHQMTLQFQENQNKSKSSQPMQNQIPKEFNTDEVNGYFKKAINAGLMEKTDNGFNWKEKKSLLAYFIERIFCKKNNDEFPDKYACLLFNTSGLRQAQHQYTGNKKTGGKPKGYKIIDNLLEDKATN